MSAALIGKSGAYRTNIQQLLLALKLFLDSDDPAAHHGQADGSEILDHSFQLVNQTAAMQSEHSMARPMEYGKH